MTPSPGPELHGQVHRQRRSQVVFDEDHQRHEGEKDRQTIENDATDQQPKSHRAPPVGGQPSTIVLLALVLGWFLLCSSPAIAVEPICPGGSSPRSDIVKCMD